MESCAFSSFLLSKLPHMLAVLPLPQKLRENHKKTVLTYLVGSVLSGPAWYESWLSLGSTLPWVCQRFLLCIALPWQRHLRPRCPLAVFSSVRRHQAVHASPFLLKPPWLCWWPVGQCPTWPHRWSMGKIQASLAVRKNCHPSSFAFLSAPRFPSRVTYQLSTRLCFLSQSRARPSFLGVLTAENTFPNSLELTLEIFLSL